MSYKGDISSSDVFLLGILGDKDKDEGMIASNIVYFMIVCSECFEGSFSSYSVRLLRWSG